MPVTSYLSVGGRMISEVTDGVILDYVPDALGSIHSVIEQDANVVKTMRYKPYGEVLSRSGTVADRHYQWVGSYGYRATFAPSSSHYVRARHYSATSGSWATVDPLWPDESAYGYVGGRSSWAVDPSGLQSGPGKYKCGCPKPGYETIIFFEGWPGVRVDPGCPPWFVDRIKRACDKLNDIPNSARAKINDCISKASARAGIRGCQPVTLNRRQCLSRFCKVDGKVHCTGLPPGNAGWSPGLQAECLGNFDRDDPSDDVWVAPGVPGSTYAEPFLGGLMTELVFVHELMHACGQHHNNSDKNQQCNDIQACCIVSVLYGKDSSKCVSGVKPPPKVNVVPKYTGRGIPNLLP